MYHEAWPMHDNPRQPSSTRRRRRWPWLLLGAALTLVTALPLMHHLAHQRLEQALHQRALQHGWQLQWQSLQVHYDFTAELTGLEATHSRGVRLRAHTLRASWDWRALIQQRRRQPRRVTLERLSVHIKPAPQAAPQAPTGDAQPQAPGWAALLRRVPLPQTRLRIQDAHVLVEGVLPDRTLELTGVTLEGAPQAEGWRATLGGRCLQGCGQPQAWSARLHHTPGSLKAEGSLEHALALTLDRPEQRLRAQVRGDNLKLHLSASQNLLTAQVKDSAASLSHRAMGQVQVALPSVTATAPLDS
jgi:hypothetical protein